MPKKSYSVGPKKLTPFNPILKNGRFRVKAESLMTKRVQVDKAKNT